MSSIIHNDEHIEPLSPSKVFGSISVENHLDGVKNSIDHINNVEETKKDRNHTIINLSNKNGNIYEVSSYGHDELLLNNTLKNNQSNKSNCQLSSDLININDIKEYLATCIQLLGNAN